MNNKARALASQLDPKAREYIEARLDEIVFDYEAKIETLNRRIERTKANMATLKAEVNARVTDMEEALSLDIPSKRRLQELVEYLKRLEETR